MVKAWCTDLAQEIAADAIQVHGGMGFIEETGAAQHLRDARILADLRGHQRHPGTGSGRPQADMSGGAAALAAAARSCARSCRGCRRSSQPGLTARAGRRRAHDAPPAGELGRTTGPRAPSPYLRLFAGTLGGFLLARGRPRRADAGRDWPGLARFYVTRLAAAGLALEAQPSPGPSCSTHRFRPPDRARSPAQAASSGSGAGTRLSPRRCSWRATSQHSSAQQAAQRPAGQHVRRPVHAEIEPRHADQQRQQHRHRHEVDLQPPLPLEPREKCAEGQIGGGSTRRMAAREARRVDRRAMREQLRPRPLDAGLDRRS